MSLAERIDAGLNPVWIKEVRQTLRSRLLRLGLVVTLMVAALGSVLTVGGAGEPSGSALFGVVYAALMFSVCGLVPFYTFYSSPGEAQASGLELTLLTGLQPGRIAAGRLLASLTHIAIFYCAFLPFLAVSALLPGVDLLAAALLLAIAALLGACTCAVAIALGAILKSRVVRALVGLGLSGVLFYVAAGGAVLALQLVARPEKLLDPDFPLVLAAALSVPVACGVYGMGAASAALAHPEENRSTPLRVATLIFAALGLVGIGIDPWVGTPTLESVAVPALLVLGLLGVPLGVFLVEPDRLGRRVRVTLPRRALALALAPLLPGGRRAVPFAAGLLIAFVGGASWLLGLAGSGAELALAREALWTALGYGAVYLLLPALLLRPWMERPGLRWLALFAMPGLCMLTLLCPTLVGFVVEHHGWSQGHHLGNPFWVVARFFTGDAAPGDGLAVQLIGLSALVASLPRAAQGWTEVAEASRGHAHAP